MCVFCNSFFLSCSVLIKCVDLSVCFKEWVPSPGAEEVNGKVSVRCTNTWLILSTYCFIPTLSIKDRGHTRTKIHTHTHTDVRAAHLMNLPHALSRFLLSV